MSAQPAQVLVSGSGVAVAIAAQLLRSTGLEISGVAQPRAAAPVVMLSEAALALLRDLSGRPDLFAGGTAVARRIVAWGTTEPVTMPHAAVVVSGAELAAGLPFPDLARATQTLFMTIHGAPPFPEAAPRRFGQRTAAAAMVELAAAADHQACFVESTADGWLFLIPYGTRQGWLLGVGAEPDILLGQSRLVAPEIATLGPVTQRFETAPSLLETLTGDDWLACGTGALAFDPICGDGTAQAAREGVLAAAVIAGIRAGDDRVALLGHYQAMLLAAMRRHLQISLPFYRGGGTTPWWREQAQAAADGYAWCTARLATQPEPRFVLHGTRLIPRERAA